MSIQAVFGILFLAMSYNNAIALRRDSSWTVAWFRHLLMTLMYAFVGFFVVVSAEHVISWYADMAGNLLMFDGMAGLAHEVQKQIKSRKDGKEKQTGEPV